MRQYYIESFPGKQIFHATDEKNLLEQMAEAQSLPVDAFCYQSCMSFASVGIGINPNSFITDMISYGLIHLMH